MDGLTQIERLRLHVENDLSEPCLASLLHEVEALEARVAAADKLAELMADGECPWREDTSNHREWWKERETALAAYQTTKEGE
jgi:hypothetical protein